MTTTFRVSEVDFFQKWRADEDLGMGYFLQRMRGEVPPSPAMEAGTAMHKALETAPTGIEVDQLSALGYVFDFVGQFDIGLTTVRELRASKVYMVDGEPITITGQVDAIEGKRVVDFKTTARFDPERYFSGMQWKLYLEIFGADVFCWDVFEIKGTDDPRTWIVYAQHTLEQYRYPDMEQDCARLVADLARFASEHLPERFTRAPPAPTTAADKAKEAIKARVAKPASPHAAFPTYAQLADDLLAVDKSAQEADAVLARARHLPEKQQQQLRTLAGGLSYE